MCARMRASHARAILIFRHPGEGRDPVPFFSLFVSAKATHFVIPAEAGIHLRLFSTFGASRKPTHVPVVFRPPSWRPGHFLCLPRESNQREGTRVERRRFAPVRYGRPGFCRQAIHGLRQKRRDPSRRPALRAGLVRPPFAAPHGLTSTAKPKQEQRRWVPAFAGTTTLGSFSDSSFEISAGLLRPGRPRSAPTGFPLGRGEDAEEKARRGARTMRARSLSGHGWPVSEPPERPREVAGQEPGDRGREGVFSLVTFSCTSKRK